MTSEKKRVFIVILACLSKSEKIEWGNFDSQGWFCTRHNTLWIWTYLNQWYGQVCLNQPARNIIAMLTILQTIPIIAFKKITTINPKQIQLCLLLSKCWVYKHKPSVNMRNDTNYNSIVTFCTLKNLTFQK